MTLYDVEKASLELREKLKKTISIRLKILLVAEFLSDLLKLEYLIPFVSYLREFEPVLSDLIRKRNFNFFTPKEIEDLINIVFKFKELEFFNKKKMNLMSFKEF